MAEKYNIVIKELLDELVSVSEFQVRERRRRQSVVRRGVSDCEAKGTPARAQIENLQECGV